MGFKTLCLCVFVSAFFFWCPFFLFAQIPSPTPFTVDETNVPIRVDGHLSHWPSARMILLNRKDQLTYGKAYWKGEDDFSGRVFLTYDEQFLYIACIVKKNGKKTVNSNEKLSLTNGDCLELFLSTHPPTGQPSRLGRGDYHIAFSPGSDCQNPQIYCLDKDRTVSGGRINA